MKIKISLFLLILFALVSQTFARNGSISIADKLGWVLAPNQNICGGYYIEPKLNNNNQSILPIKQSTTKISADYGTFSRKGVSILRGNVIVLQSGRRLTADKAILHRDPKTGKVTTIDLYGNVKAYEAGKLVVSKHAHLVVNEKLGHLDNVAYRVELYGTSVPINRRQRRLEGLVAWGQAKRAQQTAPGKSQYTYATYTTCAPNVNQWLLRADKINLDKKAGRGTARNVMLTFKGIPLFYTPYLNFPISNKRKTGFLYPIFGLGNASGAEFGLPFYMNIAPNYDAMITPIYFSKRGVMVRGDIRYLTHSSHGIFNVAVLPGDREFKKFQREAATDPTLNTRFGFRELEDETPDRYFLSWRDNRYLTRHWSTAIDYADVSDAYFFQDFGNAPEVISTNQLFRQARTDYYTNHWHFDAMVQNYKTLNAVNRQPIGTLYSRLPQFDLNGEYPSAFGGVADVFLHSQAVYFERQLGAFDTRQPLDGSRLLLQPGISLPFAWSWGYFTPSTQVQMREYDLQNTLPGEPRTDRFAIPIYDVDTGVYFDRNFHFAGGDYLQTLEPRLFYLYVPFQNQNQIPNFDSAFIPFNYEQMFRVNRFSGNDRLGDANQLTYALTTRMIDTDDGYEKFNASVGQILYFRDRRLNICSPIASSTGVTPGCTNDLNSSIGVTSNTETFSPVAGKVSYHFSPIFSINGETAYDVGERRMITSNEYVQYNPAYNSVINFGYSYLRNGDIIGIPNGAASNDLSQLSTSAAWPIFANWSVIGLFNYNINKQRPQTYYAGVSYNSCCWRLRFVVGRIFTALDQNDNAVFRNVFYVQWQLKGLGNIGTNSISDILSNQIEGYHDPFLYNKPGLLG
ncbi:MAG: LPS-assembly protein LptD [Pseudomonadota bacterium]